MIPLPDKKNELIITTLGAGAAIETFGICLFYNEDTQKLQKIRLNLIEKEDAWKPNRHTVFDKVIKGTFPKLDIIPTDIDADLIEDCVPKFATYYDKIVSTDILLIYNVMNEIHTKHSKNVWRNINFLLRVCEKPLLILMEPSILKARPRIDWLKIQLAQNSTVIDQMDEEEILFDCEPTKIEFEGSNIGLNDRLFGQIIDGSKPILMTSVKRTNIACLVKPQTPISIEQVQKQLAMLRIKRGEKGRFVKQEKSQKTFWDMQHNWDGLH